MSETIEKQAGDMTELGSTGLKQFSGVIHEEFLKQLTGNRRVKTYREMSDNDAIIGAILFVIEMLIRNVEWRVEPFENDIEADELNAEFVRQNMNDMEMTWEDFISEILSMLIYGFSPHEIVYKKRDGDSEDPERNSRFTDGKFGWRKLPLRAQETITRWSFNPAGDILGFWQINDQSKDVFIPMEKALLFRTRVRKNNPEGRSILRNAYRSWYFKKKIENIEGIGIERDLAGLPVALVPPDIMAAGATPQQKAILNAIREIVTNIRRDEQEGVIFPAIRDENGHLMYELKLLSTGGTRQFDTSKIIGRYSKDIAITVLADFILLGHEKVGSFSLSSDKTNMFATALGAWLNSISQVLNRVAIARLFRVNGMPTDRLPKIVPGDIESVDLKVLGEYIGKLAGAGAELFPDNDLENFLRRVGNMPEKQEDATTGRRDGGTEGAT